MHENQKDKRMEKEDVKQPSNFAGLKKSRLKQTIHKKDFKKIQNPSAEKKSEHGFAGSSHPAGCGFPLNIRTYGDAEPSQDSIHQPEDADGKRQVKGDIIHHGHSPVSQKLLLPHTQSQWKVLHRISSVSSPDGPESIRLQKELGRPAVRIDPEDERSHRSKDQRY
jgi:hypothetical protein